MKTAGKACFASVIIPVYNAERWLSACLESVLNQTCDDYEVLLVDDGSKDGSGQLLDAYQQAQPHKIRVIHQKNQGVSCARNHALKFAQGEFLLFADADDLLHPQLIETLKAAEQAFGADCYFWPFESFEEEATFQPVRRVGGNEVSAEALLKQALASDGDVLGYVWNKAFRRSVVREFVFDADIALQEDLLFVCRCLAQTALQRCVRLEHALYGYRQHAASATHKTFSEKQMTILLARERMIHVLKQGSAGAVLEGERLAAQLPVHLCVMNKKLLHNRVAKQKEAFALIDRLWGEYASCAHPAGWPLKERMYFHLQKICYGIRKFLK